MRIVQAVGWYFPESLGGTEIYVAALARRLALAGHEVTVAAPDATSRHEQDYVHDGIAVYRYPVATDVTRDQARGRTAVPGAERFHAWLLRTQADIVHFHTFVTGLSLPEVHAARGAGARVIVTSHAASLGFACARGTLMRFGEAVCDGAVTDATCATCVLEQRGVPISAAAAVGHLPVSIAAAAARLPSPAGTALGMHALIAEDRLLQRSLFDAIESFVVLSDFAAAAIVNRGAPLSKVRVNRLGVARIPEAAADRETGAVITFGYIGRAESIKGLDDAVAAFLQLPKDVPARLRAWVITSTDRERQDLEQLRAQAAGDPRITFDPPVAPEAIASLLSSLDVLLCPSRAVEGGPTVALEAHAVGTPVIGSRVPALSEIVQNGVDGLLHEAGDVSGLLQCLMTVVNNPNTVSSWRGRIRRPRSQDDVAKDYLALYGG